MKSLRYPRSLGAVGVFGALLSGCGTLPGQPRAGSKAVAPDAVLDFNALYSGNCAGCHGEEGRGGAAMGIGDPVYLALVDDAAMRNVIVTGVKGTAMPAFAQSAGGMLTGAQIDVIVRDLRSRWSRQGILEGANPPSYAAKSGGNAQHGEGVYATFCQACHGPGGHGGPRASAITNSSFLALVSDQGLRTVVIAGRPELGMPDWRGDFPGSPMSEQDVADVVAWLASQRVQTPGQPYTAANSGPP
jgi:cytochrome c oxidase cbb3-type subunit III